MMIPRSAYPVRFPIVVILLAFVSCQTPDQHSVSFASGQEDWRSIREGDVIPSQNYCDQPYIVITPDQNWLCTMTTGKGIEGEPGQHIVATISRDQGKTWSELIDIEPETGPEASWVVPLVIPSGRVYAFYTYNGDQITGRRADMLGWYVFKYSDDYGRTWSKKRYRLPLRKTACDMNNGLEGTQIFWGIDKPMIFKNHVFFGFTKLGKYMLEMGEGWFFTSSTILTESNPDLITWEMRPEGERGLRAEEFGSIQEEHNIVALRDGTLYCMYRTATGHPCHAYSFDQAKTWTTPQHATYSPEGKKIKNNRACPAIWKTKDGKYLLWFNNLSDKSYQKRNPVWITGGLERNGRIHWAQPEILFYDPDPDVRISYPDLIEDKGKIWISYTQKSIARVSLVDPSLLTGLWEQGNRKSEIASGLVFKQDLISVQPVRIPPLPSLQNGGGFTLDFWLWLEASSAEEEILTTVTPSGRGMTLSTGSAQNLCFSLSDGSTRFEIESDRKTLSTHQWHHIAIIVDGASSIVSLVVDGQLCDGGENRVQGWLRFDSTMQDSHGEDHFSLADPDTVRIRKFKIYNRYLRTSEAISNFNAGP